MNVHNKKYNQWIIIVVFIIALLLTTASILRTAYATKPTLYLMNDSGKNYSASYFSNNDGAWKISENEINPDGSVSAQLIHTKIFQPALFWITIGQKMGLFYCSAMVELPAFSDSITVIQQDGNCHFLRTKENKLFMIIDPRTTNK